jgi:hypothetical protein
MRSKEYEKDIKKTFTITPRYHRGERGYTENIRFRMV